MKLGAQLFSLRTYLKDADGIRDTFRRVKKIGYDNVQLSGAAAIDPYILKDISEETSLPIVLTHMPFERIVNDTEALIAEHKIFTSPVIGLGAMPDRFRGSREGLSAFLDALSEPVKKINSSGLSFAYHNHDFEFKPLENGELIYDAMLDSAVSWQFVPDIYWIRYAGYSELDYMKRIGKGRLVSVHFKDMADDPQRSICAVGKGTVDFKPAIKLARELGAENILVEQDNAVDFSDPFGEMKTGYDTLSRLLEEKLDF